MGSESNGSLTLRRRHCCGVHGVSELSLQRTDQIKRFSIYFACVPFLWCAACVLSPAISGCVLRRTFCCRARLLPYSVSLPIAFALAFREKSIIIAPVKPAKLLQHWQASVLSRAQSFVGNVLNVLRTHRGASRRHHATPFKRTSQRNER